MPRDQLVRMEVDTKLLYHRKARKLQQMQPVRWPLFMVAYLALLGEAWMSQTRDISVADSWVPALAGTDAKEVVAVLKAAGYLDRSGKLPADAWDEWVGPTIRRVASARNAAAVRWGTNRNATAMPIDRERESEGGSRPGKTPDKTIISRSRAPREGPVPSMTPFKDAMAQAGLKLPDSAQLEVDPLTPD